MEKLSGRVKRNLDILAASLIAVGAIFGITASAMLQQRNLIAFEATSFLAFFFVWIGTYFAMQKFLDNLSFLLSTAVTATFTLWMVFLSRSYFFAITDSNPNPDPTGPVSLIVLAVLQGIFLVSLLFYSNGTVIQQFISNRKSNVEVPEKPDFSKPTDGSR